MTTYDDIKKELLQCKNKIAIYEGRFESMYGFVREPHDQLARDIKHLIELTREDVKAAENL